MDDVACLRRTIRRCTVVLVAAIAVAAHSFRGASVELILLFVAVLLYFAFDLFRGVLEVEKSADGSGEA
jgi:hypothetical protein